MVCAGVLRQVNRASQATAFGIVRPIDHLTNAGLHQSPCAHWTGFQCHDQCALIQSPVTEDQGCLAQSHEFSMTQWI